MPAGRLPAGIADFFSGKGVFPMPILKLKPACKDYLWGGERLRDEYYIASDKHPLAEAWMLSCHPDGPSIIQNEPFIGMSLADYIRTQGREILGSDGIIFQDFPILIKLIDARENLSIQVHPSNLFAMKNEGQYGKTELWYILEAEPGAFLYYGFQHEITPAEFTQRIRDNTLTEVLNAVRVKRGDVFFITPGTLHAIGKGIVLAEIQQNSNLTYRVYDYGRLDKDGRSRTLHVEKALKVTHLCPPRTDWDFGRHLARCQYFTTDCIEGPFRDVCDEESFTSLLILSGNGEIDCGREHMSVRKGESLFLPAGSGAYCMTGNCTLLQTRVGTI